MRNKVNKGVRVAGAWDVLRGRDSCHLPVAWSGAQEERRERALQGCSATGHLSACLSFLSTCQVPVLVSGGPC